jgi:hypothetical protein
MSAGLPPTRRGPKTRWPIRGRRHTGGSKHKLAQLVTALRDNKGNRWVDRIAMILWFHQVSNTFLIARKQLQMKRNCFHRVNRSLPSNTEGTVN